MINPHDHPLDVRAEVLLQDGTTQAAPKPDRAAITRTVTVAPCSRLTLAVTALGAAAFVPGLRTEIGIRIAAHDPNAELYVEQAVCGTPPGGPAWSTGSAHRATR